MYLKRETEKCDRTVKHVLNITSAFENLFQKENTAQKSREKINRLKRAFFLEVKRKKP